MFSIRLQQLLFVLRRDQTREISKVKSDSAFRVLQKKIVRSIRIIKRSWNQVSISGMAHLVQEVLARVPRAVQVMRVIRVT